MSPALIPSSFNRSRWLDFSAVRRIETSYTARGLLHKVTSYNAASGGTVVNEVERRYDAFNILIEDRQAHDGAVSGSTSKVQYAHTSGAGNQLRRTSLTYPNGRQLDSLYGSGNSIDDHLNRISALQVNGETDPLVNYTYAGLAWQVVVGLPQPEVELNYKRQSGEPISDAGDIYFGYDRFGRSIDLRWQKAGTPLVHLQYGFDAKGRRTWRNDLVSPTSAQQDRHYGYDSLSQVVAEDRGDINVNRTAIAGVPARGSRWDYDETGNWKRYEQLANGTTTLDQPRTHDKGNCPSLGSRPAKSLRLEDAAIAAKQWLLEIGAGAGPIRVDPAGRMLELPPVEGAWDETFEIVWDAWSRIVEVKQGESTVGKYAYDGLTRRITRETGGDLIHTYYSDTWRPLEDRVTSSESPGTPTVKAHYLWGARHRDDLVRRDRSTTTPGTLSETRYVLLDYFSAAAITDASGTVIERYSFSAFGLRSISATDYSPRTASESTFEFSFQGQFEDIETGWLNYGYRYYIPALGRWPSKDPIQERGGLNLYRSSINSPVNLVDFIGLCSPHQLSDHFGNCCCPEELFDVPQDATSLGSSGGDDTFPPYRDPDHPFLPPPPSFPKPPILPDISTHPFQGPPKDHFYPIGPQGWPNPQIFPKRPNVTLPDLLYSLLKYCMLDFDKFSPKIPICGDKLSLYLKVDFKYKNPTDPTRINIMFQCRW